MASTVYREELCSVTDGECVSCLGEFPMRSSVVYTKLLDGGVISDLSDFYMASPMDYDVCIAVSL